MNKIWEPYNLVWVKTEDGSRSSVAQIISRMTGAGTIMIRRVPGDPSTMVEIPISRITAPAKGKWVHYAEVFGTLQFPVDMLRHDSAEPVNFELVEDEIGRIKTVIREGTGDKLIVARVSETKSWLGWHEDRWLSFGWGIRLLDSLPIRRP